MGIKGFAAGVGIAALFVVGVACSGSDVDDQKQAVVETAPQPAAAPAQVDAVPPSPTLQSAPAPATPQQEKICANAIGVDRHTAPYVAVRAKLGLDDPSLRQRGPTRRWVESDRDRHD
ncbi:MAG: hypothetical protein QGG34_09695 [SAR202 cluster bacterium]|jgi:hypothetical protein|nr:hypothetical protein [SAR202 cluster bacterium]MDP6300916.1 hypothetical protein [SAR202 cluster bacterium]MDP7103257.1 hypothetical protein [SAR202 cluster bacterium]|tara:strand:- start:221 stop:574 length:354 start_codon:yes stop_codon:yes gene_type:complete